MSQSIDWYFDYLSPFSYVQFERLQREPRLQLRYYPVLFAGLLNHWGQLGPAEIPPKRRFVYQQAVWLGARHGCPVRLPAAHPFNPLGALRLTCALGATPEVVAEIFRFVWRDGKRLDTDWRLLVERLGVSDADELANSDAAKAQLKGNGEQAIARGVFGVPTAVLPDGRLFWGLDATEMLLDNIAGDPLFASAEYARASDLPSGVHRRGRG